MFMAATEKTESKEKKVVRKKPKEEAPAKAAVEAPKAPEQLSPPKAAAHEHPAHVPAAAGVPKAAAHEAKPKTEKKRKGKAPKKVTRAVVARGKRKTSIARATIKAGKGVVRFNSANITALNNPYVREIILEPLHYIGPEANGIDIAVNVNGGGMMGQAQAARTAIANALVLYFDTMDLRSKFIDIDRSLIIEDTRRVETKKYKGPKARARFQKSYR